jgi:hypothetical protein
MQGKSACHRSGDLSGAIAVTRRNPVKGMKEMIDPKREAELLARLDSIHRRVEWMATTEGRAALVKGIGANGEFWPEKKRLLDETDRILDELTK